MNGIKEAFEKSAASAPITPARTGNRRVTLPKIEEKPAAAADEKPAAPAAPATPPPGAIVPARTAGAPITPARGVGRPPLAKSLANWKAATLSAAVLASLVSRFPFLSVLSVDNIPVEWPEEKINGLKALFGDDESAWPALVREAKNRPMAMIPASLGDLAKDEKPAEIPFAEVSKFFNQLEAAVVAAMKLADSELGEQYAERLENAQKVAEQAAKTTTSAGNSDIAPADAPDVQNLGL